MTWACAHDVALRHGEQVITTAEAIAPVIVEALRDAIVRQVVAAVQAALAETVATTTLPALCTKCGAACVVEATFAAGRVATTLHVTQ